MPLKSHMSSLCPLRFLRQVTLICLITPLILKGISLAHREVLQLLYWNTTPIRTTATDKSQKVLVYCTYQVVTALEEVRLRNKKRKMRVLVISLQLKFFSLTILLCISTLLFISESLYSCRKAKMFVILAQGLTMTTLYESISLSLTITTTTT